MLYYCIIILYSCESEYENSKEVQETPWNMKPRVIPLYINVQLVNEKHNAH